MGKNEKGINFPLFYFLFSRRLPRVIVLPCINSNSCRTCGGIPDIIVHENTTYNNALMSKLRNAYDF